MHGRCQAQLARVYARLPIRSAPDKEEDWTQDHQHVIGRLLTHGLLIPPALQHRKLIVVRFTHSHIVIRFLILSVFTLPAYQLRSLACLSRPCPSSIEGAPSRTASRLRPILEARRASCEACSISQRWCTTSGFRLRPTSAAHPRFVAEHPRQRRPVQPARTSPPEERRTRRRAMPILFRDQKDVPVAGNQHSRLGPTLSLT